MDKGQFLREFQVPGGARVKYYSIIELEKMGYGKVSRLPYSLKVVLESMLRNFDGKAITWDDVVSLANWNPRNPEDRDIPLVVSRILMQDFTGVPALVDLAAMRDYIKSRSADPGIIRPSVPVDLIIDHSVQVDQYNSTESFETNLDYEIKRNSERYTFLKWAGQAFQGLRIFPPSAGICHQINLEYLAKLVMVSPDGLAYFDSLVGTDSHTTMINGIGVVGFGVGGIEAEAAMLGQPISFIMPQVVGVKLIGKLNDGVTATDLALTLTRLLREKGVVGKFVEFFGKGVESLSVPDRATVSNMCPEYGATVALFPVDKMTVKYLKLTARSQEQIQLIEQYYREQGIYEAAEYSEVIELDLGSVKPSLSGPSQPKQQMELKGAPESFVKQVLQSQQPRSLKGMKDGDIVIASITSCTNTSNPSVLIMAGLVAKKAVEMGLHVDTSKVKTSLAPGSRVVTEYLKRTGLLRYLEELGFYVVAYGCTTCIGNSGPLADDLSRLVNEGNMAVVSVLSGNRNFEGRIHNDVRANYLMSPPLVVAYAIAGTILKDITKEPIGISDNGKEVYLQDIWPSTNEVNEIVKNSLDEDLFRQVYNQGIFSINPLWNRLETPSGMTYSWDEKSTYIRKPPFFEGITKGQNIEKISNAAILAIFGDSISTDHISPAGAIMPESPAGRYLKSLGVPITEFNTYGARRGNHEVMMRGTFANRHIRNLLLENTEGGLTLHFPDKQLMSIYDAAMKYRDEGRPLVIIAGKEYGSGSSRDWAAKGPALLGVRAVMAESFERIHRSNLIGMGIIPLQFKSNYKSLDIDASKPLSITIEKRPRGRAVMMYCKKDGQDGKAELISRIDSELEMNYVTAGGILNFVVSRIAGSL
ncbi:MAG: aconitate hydratase AcnA [Conexivisphaerales archaeon]